MSSKAETPEEEREAIKAHIRYLKRKPKRETPGRILEFLLKSIEDGNHYKSTYQR